MFSTKQQPLLWAKREKDEENLGCRNKPENYKKLEGKQRRIEETAQKHLSTTITYADKSRNH